MRGSELWLWAFPWQPEPLRARLAVPSARGCRAGLGAGLQRWDESRHISQSLPRLGIKAKAAAPGRAHTGRDVPSQPGDAHPAEVIPAAAGAGSGMLLATLPS